MVCRYTFANGDIVEGKSALKAYLASGDNLAKLLPDRVLASPAFRSVNQTIPAGRMAMVESTASALSSAWANPPKIVVYTDMNDPKIPPEVRAADQKQRSGGATGEPEGFYYQGTAYLSAGLQNPSDVTRVLYHEGLGHYGLRGVFGSALKPVLDQIVALRKNDVLDKARQYGLDTAKPDDLLQAAEEVLSTMAQTKPEIGFVQRALAAIRSWLRKNVPGMASLELSDAEVIRDYIMPARAFVERGRESGSAEEQASFSRAAPKPTGLTLPEQGLLLRLQASLQDNFNRVRQLQQRIADMTGHAVSDYANYYGAETQRPGRIAARLEDFERKMTAPLMAKLAKSGHTSEQLSELLHAMHAKERNEAVAKINPDMPDGGSGMTTADAAKILKQYRTNTTLHALADEARDIARTTLELKLSYGLIDTDTFATLSELYDHYVPLKGDGEYGPKIKRAMGHDEREEFILQNIARDYQQAIVVGEKNLARQSLLSMALENPDKELWTVGVPPRGRYVAGTVFSVRKGKAEIATFTSKAQVTAFLEGAGAQAAQYEVYANGERVREFVKPLQDNEVPVYVDGQMVRIQIVGDEQLARQLRPFNQGQMHPILEFMRATNRYLARIYTGYNPSFIIRNTARDAMTGSVNMIGNEGISTAARAWSKYPSAMKALFAYAATGEVPSGDAGKMLEEYRQNGGKTGASWMSDLEQQGKTLQRLFDDAYGATGYLKDKNYAKAASVAGRKIVGGMAHTVEVLNQATENGLRLALYMAMRQEGRSAGEAAQASKSVTVDFDRRGTLSPAVGAVYLFFNPAVQGTANAIKTLVKGKKKEQAWVALGVLSALGFYMASQGMDDDKDRWLGEDWESRSKNLILNLGKTHLRVPVSMEFAPFYAAGVALAEAKRNGTTSMAAAGHIVSSFLNAYFPLQGAFDPESDNPSLDAVGAAIPTIIKPGFQIAANRNAFGSQVVPDNEFTKDRPDNLKMFRGTKGSPYDTAAQAIASAGEATGAGKYENDISKVSPETLKLLWRTYTGGLGQFVADMAGLGNVGSSDPASLEPSDVPIVKDFVKPNDVKAIRGRYYDLAKEAREAAEEFRQAKKAGDDAAMDDILNSPDKSEMLGFDRMMRATSKAASALRDEMVDINADTSLDLAAKRAKLKELEKDEEALYRDAIAALSR